MKVSLSWLEQYVNVDLAPAALADGLTMAGLEVEGVFERLLNGGACLQVE